MDEIIAALHGSIEILEDMDRDSKQWTVICALRWCAEELDRKDMVEDMLRDV